MMDDYIEREAARNAIFDMYCKSDGDGYVWILFGDAIRRIDNLPSVERKKGKWVKARGSWFTPGGDPVWECSLCGKGVHVYGIEHGTYGSDIADGQWIACPNCGADMRGET